MTAPKFDRSISFGTIISLATMLAMMAGVYAGMRSEFAESRAHLEQVRIEIGQIDKRVISLGALVK